MARGLNKVQLIGNLGGDPETKYLPSGTLAATLNIATSDGRKNAQGEWEDFTEWHRVVLYGRRAEICREYLHKGSRVYIEGRLQTRSWDDNNGQRHYMTEIVGTDILMLDSREQASNIPQSYHNPADSDDDLPF